VLAKDLEPLYALLGIVPGEKEALLEALAPLFSTNSGYTQFKAYMKKHGIAFDTFTY
jgi:Fe-S cluster assembly scaffold protein SufB